MFKGDETPDDIIRLVIEKIEAMPNGLRDAFAHDGRIQLYTGPNKDYRPLLIGPDFEARFSLKKSRSSNGKRAAKQAKEKGWNATLLDDTAIGQFLFVENDLYKHLLTLYKGDKRVADRAGLKVMNFVSALFIRAAFGDVKTAVCGADRSRVFYGAEMDGMHDRKAYPSEAELLVDRLLDNKDIMSINGTPINVFRALRDKEGREAVYDRICLTELRERKEHAYKTGKKADYRDYLDRLELYRTDKAERVYASTPVASRPKAYQELALPKTKRRAIKHTSIKEFEAAAKAVTSRTASPSAPSARKMVVKAHTAKPK